MVTAQRRDSLLGTVKPTATFLRAGLFYLFEAGGLQHMHTESFRQVSSDSVRRCASPVGGMCDIQSRLAGISHAAHPAIAKRFMQDAQAASGYGTRELTVYAEPFYQLALA